jgi:hypothetical protein
MFSNIKEKIKKWGDNGRRIFELEADVDKLLTEKEYLVLRIDELEKKSTAEVVLEKVMKRGIEWFDYEELSDNDKKLYYNEIQQVIKNKSFINELNHLIADQVEYIARESKNHEDTMNVRMTINAVDLIKERLEGIYDPSIKKPSEDEVFEAV